MARISSRRAFTLIELLIVIAIIGILMALLFPAVGGAIDAARKAQAKNDVTQIATAVTAYETEYGRLPTTNGGDVDDTLVKILTAQNDTMNPRKIVFIEVGTAKKGKSGTNSMGGAFIDPWGGPYQIKVDKDYVNQITSVGWNPSVTVRKRVAVWNDPSKGTNDNATDAKKKRRYVNSWD